MVHRIRLLIQIAVLGWLGASLTGCYVGLDSVLFMTKTQVAVHGDTQPPALDIGYKRDEIVLAPVFENGGVLPVMASIRQGASFGGFFSDQAFATGDAAIIMTKEFVSDNEACGDHPAEYCPNWLPPSATPGTVANELSKSTPLGRSTAAVLPTPGTVAEELCKIPRGSAIRAKPFAPPTSLWGKIKDMFGGDAERKRKRYFFGTQTGLGVHADWNSSQVPRDVSIGFNRKEMAFVPLIETDAKDAAGNVVPGKVDVKLASLIATVISGAEVGGQAATAVDNYQTFATGDAATYLAAHPGIRSVLAARIDPEHARAKLLQDEAERKAQDKIDRARTDSKALTLEAQDLIGKMGAEADVDAAKENAVASGLLTQSEDVKYAALQPTKDKKILDIKKDFLKRHTVVFDNHARQEALRKFVDLLNKRG